MQCCNSSSVDYEDEITFTTPSHGIKRSRSNNSFHKSTDERQSTANSNYRSTVFLQTIYEDDTSIDGGY
jgi:hypothetical protein